MIYSLPKSVDIGGVTYDIRWDYRPILDICIALSDPDLSDEERAFVALYIFYPGFKGMLQAHYKEAVARCIEFINCGAEAPNKKSPRLVDWEHDFPLIVNPVNRVLGREIREETPLHWFSFVSAYQEIGDCAFAQVIRIRDKKARGKQLDKPDREWYQRNREIVDIPTKYSKAEEDFLREWGGA